MNNKTRFIILTVIGLLLLALVLVRVNLRRMLDTLAAADYVYLLPALVAQMLFFVIKAWRWRFLIPSERRVPYSTLFSTTLMGYFGNQIIGASTGELLRSIVLGQKEKWSKTATLGTVFVEHMWDILVLCILLLAMLRVVPLPPLVLPVAQTAVLVLLLGGLVVALLLFRGQWAARLVGAVANRLSERMARRIMGMLQRFTEGVRAMQEWRRSLLALLLTFPQWLVLTVSYYFLGRAALIPLGVTPYLFPAVVIALAATIPNPPWNVGMLEILSITTLGVFGVADSQALAFVVLMRAMRLVPIIWGYALFSREGYGLRTRARPDLEAEHPG